MKELKTYILEFGTPTLQDIEQCVSSAVENNCVVKLVWYVSAYEYSEYLYAESDAAEIFDRIDKMIYGL